MGAFAAAVVAEAITLKDAVILVRSRAEKMEQLYPVGYGLAAIVGLNERQVTAYRRFSTHGCDSGIRRKYQRTEADRNCRLHRRDAEGFRKGDAGTVPGRLSSCTFQCRPIVLYFHPLLTHFGSS